jgi:hypothetical protein
MPVVRAVLPLCSGTDAQSTAAFPFHRNSRREPGERARIARCLQVLIRFADLLHSRFRFRMGAI